MRLGVMPLSPWGQWSITGCNSGGVVPKLACDDRLINAAEAAFSRSAPIVYKSKMFMTA